MCLKCRISDPGAAPVRRRPQGSGVVDSLVGFVRAVPGTASPARPDVLPGHEAAAGVEATTRPRSVRVRPLRRRDRGQSGRHLSGRARGPRWTPGAPTFLAGLDGAPIDDPLLPAVLHTIERFQLDRGDFALFLRSMAMDLTVTTLSDLRRPDRLHGRVGRGDRRDDAADPRRVRPGRGDPAARELGRAFQLTNFIRDVGEDFQRGRIYLPQADLGVFGVTSDDLAAAVAGRVASARGQAADRVRGGAGTRALPRRAARDRAARSGSRGCIRTAYRLYQGILDEIETRRLRRLRPAGRRAPAAGRSTRRGRRRCCAVVDRVTAWRTSCSRASSGRPRTGWTTPDRTSTGSASTRRRPSRSTASTCRSTGGERGPARSGSDPARGAEVLPAGAVGNPTASELMWLPDDLYEVRTPLGDELIGDPRRVPVRAAGPRRLPRVRVPAAHPAGQQGDPVAGRREDRQACAASRPAGTSGP